MDSDRVIGRVLNVDSFRVTVEVDKDTKSLTKAHYTGICPVARINSYIIIPVGYEKIVGHVTRVQMFSEATEVQNRATIALPDVKRLVWATMIGTIKKAGESEAYEQGITAFPSLDNPVWFVLKEELDCIFDKSTGFDEDALRTGGGRRYYVPIGRSTAFPDYEVKIDPDAVFSKHLAVLGNTGSGKSCTIATFIQTILRTDFGGRKVSNAHIVIFDTNGEYSSAFADKEGKPAAGNALLVDRDGLRIPYWFMNLDDFINVFRPGEGAQLPVLSQAVLLARNKADTAVGTDAGVLSVLEEMRSHYRNRRRSITTEDMDAAYHAVVSTNDRKDRLVKATKAFVQEATAAAEVSFRMDIDTPSHFDRDKLLREYVEAAIRQSERSNSRIRDYCATMLMRMQKYFQDPRYDFVFHSYPEAIEAALATFLRLVFGRMANSVHGAKSPLVTNEHFGLKEYYRQTNGSKANHQVIIIDFSLVATDVLENVTALIARLMLEFLQLMGKDKDLRGEFPVVLVLEEAHNYIPEKKAKHQDLDSISKVVFERIAREGRRFGLSLVVSSQRPSELSRTVLSQCNSFIVHRIQNPEDQKYIQTIIPSINEDLLKQLPSLAQRTALVFGDCVRAPAQVVMNEARPLPDSKDPRFMRHWLRLDAKAPEEPKFEETCKTWERAGDTKGSPPADGRPEESKNAS